MDVLLYLIPIALIVGGISLWGLLWSMKSGQFEDLDGAANRILFDDDENEQQKPISPDEKPGSDKPD